MMPSLPPALVECMHQHHYRPEALKSTGCGFLRFPVGNEPKGNTSGYIKLFADGEGAVFGDFKSGLQVIWNGRDEKTWAPAERKAREDALKTAREELSAERSRFQAAAAAKAAEIYASAQVANADHPYLARKRINPYGHLRQAGSQLFVPVHVGGRLTSLQFIEEDGTKRFLSGGEIRGGCCVLGTPTGIICIAEGYATGCSIHEATGHAVAVAFNAGNLLPVAQAIRQQYKDATLILCADNDQWTENNPGLTKAREAAMAVQGLLAVPDFSGCDLSSRPTDFNDLHLLAGPEAINRTIVATRGPLGIYIGVSHPPTTNFNPAVNPAPTSPDPSAPHLPTASYPPGPDDAASKEETSTTAPEMRDEVLSVKPQGFAAGQETSPAQLRELLAPLAPPHMPEVGFPPLIKDIVTLACDSSEAHPVAVAANILAYFSATIGRVIYQNIGDSVIHSRPFILIVGKSGKARKGTAEATVAKIFERTQSILNQSSPGVNDHLKVYKGSLSTGEGLAMHLRDAREGDGKGKSSDPGVSDKRLLVTESEFENVFSHTRRDSNNLSATIRNLFDGLDIRTLTKTDSVTATRPHLCITGHITGPELKLKASNNDFSNGFLNRFMMVYVYRPKLVPLPQRTPAEKIEALAQRMANVIRSVTSGNLHGDNLHEVTFNDEAQELWKDQYENITRDRKGKMGSLLARADMYARMLAMIFAALDSRFVIELRDLHAAIAWVEYWRASLTYVFNCEEDEGELDPFVAEVLKVVIENPGISLSALQAKWLHKRTKQVKEALELLLNLAPPVIEQRKERTVGRPVLRYFACEKK